jgi:TfoX/Sxy family transcriptional regulator of competence genes
MAHDPKALQAILAGAAPDIDLTFRAMFGGIMGYAGGLPFASLSDVGLALKMSGEDHAALSAMPDARALRYAPDQPPSKSYVVVPDAMMSDPVALRAWIGRSVAGLKPAAQRRRRSPTKG